MQYEVEVGGRRLQVVVTRSGDGFAVAVDGRARQVDAARIDAHTLSLLVDVGDGLQAVPSGKAQSHEVSVAADPISG